MTLKLNDKKVIVNEVMEVAQKASSLVAVEYSGLTVTEINNLRKSARKANVYVRVVRNTLARRALQDTQFTCLQEDLIGPLMLMFSRDDAGAAAKLVREFIKQSEKLKVKVIAVNNQRMTSQDLNKLADLPTPTEAITKLVCVMNAPIVKLVRTLAESYAKLVRTLAVIRDKKQAGS